VSALGDFQDGFVRALMDPTLPPPAALAGSVEHRVQRRFAVYRNNVAVSLSRALRAAYPATARVVGDAFFAATARAYVTGHIPERPALIAYGAGFAEFLERFPPALRTPYLPDLARLERARLVAYHAADAEPLDPGRLAAVPPDQLMHLRFALAPATAIVRSRFPVVTVWMMNSGLRELGPVDFSAPEDALVSRPGIDVEVRLLRPGAARFLLAVSDGTTLGAAAGQAFAEEPTFDLAASLADSLAAGIFSALRSDPEQAVHG
jgi:hypothetical protein